MQTRRSTRIAGAVGLCLLTLPLAHLSRPLPPPDAAALPAVPPPRSPSEAARRAARRYFVPAQQAGNRERQALAAWGPGGVGRPPPEPLPRPVLAPPPGACRCPAVEAG